MALWRISHPSTEPPALMERTELPGDGVVVETVFVGHGAPVEGEPPVLWVTSVTGGLLDGAHWTHPSASAAERGHEVAVDAARRCGS